MTSSNFSEVSVTAFLRRMLLVAGLAASTVALAQPANDLCANAQVLPPAGPFPVLSTTVSLTGVALASESTFSCLTTPTNTNSSVWYSFTPAASGTYVISNCAGVAGNTLSDTVLAVYTGTCAGPVALACNDDACSTKSSVAVNLTSGVTYLIQAAKFGSTAAASTDTMQIQVDRIIPPANDTCSGTIPAMQTNLPTQVTFNAATQNDSQTGGGSACFLGIGHSTSTTTNPAPGPDTVLQFVPPSSGTYSFRATPVGSTSSDAVLYLTDGCVSAMTPPQTYSPPQCIAAANRVGTSSTGAEELVCVTLNAGVPVFVWTDHGTTTATQAYDVEVTQCVAEVEPNDAPATAGAPACPLTGRITPAADVDFYSLGSPTLPARVFALVDGNASGVSGSSNSNFDLRVTSATATLEYDDSNNDSAFGGSSANVAGTPLIAGANYLRVNHNSATTATEPYRLYSVVQTATAVAELEPNNTLANASGGADDYFSGDVTGTTDIDLFTFTATAGELVFLSLDKQPARTSSAATSFALALLDSAGVVLATAADGATTSTTTAGASLTSTTPTAPADALVYRVRAAGRYFARVTRSSSSGTGAYLLSVSKNCATGGGLTAPSVTSISPDNGDTAGGNQVTITGSNFVAPPVVLFGTTAATVVSSNGTSITVLVPPGIDGQVNVVVRNAGNLTATLTNGYRYNAPNVPPTVTAIAPALGPADGGTNVTIDGTNFKTGAEVTFLVGATPLPATNVALVSATRLTATTPAHAPGLATVTVRNPVDMMEGSLPNGFEYLAAPTVSSLTPNTGLIAGGTVVTVTGTGFRPQATVRFGAVAGTAVTVTNDTTLTVTTPSVATPGAVAVSVTNVDAQAGSLAAGFTYTYPAPTLTTVAPTLGPAAGGTALVLTGTNFYPNPTVTIGGVAATAVSRTSLTRITATTPPGTIGFADVVVTNTDNGTVTLPMGFEYAAAPTVASVTPSTATVLGAVTVTITGTGFRTGATVRFGANAGTAVTVNSPTSITVTVPSATLAGAVNLTVTNTDSQVGTLTNGFTYTYPPPTITSITPASGYSTGGTNVSVNGTNFYPGATLTIGGTAVTNLVRVSATRITGTTPVGTPGPADVVVGNTDGQRVTLTGGFTYVPSPTLTAIAPNHGPVQGGTLVTVTGTNFIQGAALFIGGVPAFAVTVTSPTTATAVTNSSALGTFDVRLVNPDAQAATLPMAFTFDPAPTLTSVVATEGTTAGGDTVTLTGTGFLTGATVLFGTTPATSVTVVSATQLTAVTPAHAAGVVSLTTRNTDGQYAELPRAFRFVPPPTFDSLSPVSGDVAGGTLVTLRGSGFAATAQVSFGGAASADVTYVSATELTAVTPAHARGAVDVVVTVDGASATRAAAFTYTRGAPTLAQLAPLSGPTAGGVMLTLTGTGFADGATVTLGGAAATSVVIVSPNLARAVIPAHAAGQVDVVLTNDDAQAATLTNGFTYVAPVDGTSGTLVDGGSGALGTEPVGGGGGQGGVSCGCTSVDGSMVSMLGFVMVAVLSRRRRRS